MRGTLYPGPCSWGGHDGQQTDFELTRNEVDLIDYTVAKHSG